MNTMWNMQERSWGRR